ncbi:MAG: MMPL family transporter [Antricoccus sp.]
MQALAAGIYARRRLVLIASGILMAVFVGVGIQAFGSLTTNGLSDTHSQAYRASELKVAKFGPSPDLVVLITAPEGTKVSDPAALETGKMMTAQIIASGQVSDVTSYFTTGAAALAADQQQSALVSARITAKSDSEALTILREKVSVPDGWSVRFGGGAAIGNDLGNQVGSDLGLIEGVAVPITMILLFIVFGSLVSALLPLAVGAFAIFGAFMTLFVITRFTEVTTYSLNLVTGLGLALAVDYSLLIVSRFREELGGYSTQEALSRTLRTAGKTVLFTGVAVALCTAALIVFPITNLKSFGYGAVAVVAFATIGALVVLPALLATAGHSIDSGRLWGRGAPLRSASAHSPRFKAFVSRVIHQPASFTILALIILAVMAVPLRAITLGTPDERSLNTSADSRAVGDALRTDYQATGSSDTYLIVDGASNPELASYTERLSKLDGVDLAAGPVGSYHDGNLVPANSVPLPNQVNGTTALIELSASAKLNNTADRQLVSQVRGLSQPADSSVLVGGQTAQEMDDVQSLINRVPLAATLIAITMFVLLFLFTGSVILPLKAIVLCVLALSATIGAVVWVFEDGHFAAALGFSPAPIDMSMLILIFCVAFGLSMDYELFLLSRIKERHDAGDDLPESVSSGLASSARITTTAAAVVAITFIAFGLSKITFLQMFGLGTGLAILLDATLIRLILLPALMKLMGAANWWAPKPLRRFHNKFGVSESLEETSDSPRRLTRV